LSKIFPLNAEFTGISQIFIKLALIKSSDMKKIQIFILLTGLLTSTSYSQYSAVMADPSFRYVAAPGFVNVTELSGALGLEDSVFVGPAGELSITRYYFGITNIFGYQIDRNFFGGVGIGYYYFEGGDFLLPLYLEYKFNLYLKRFTPYFYGDGGTLIHLADFTDESKIFINPGVGISRAISPQLEINLSAGYMIQARSTLTRVTFVNFKLGVTFRKNDFRMFRKD
jgi:hypothetical protein